MMRTARPCRRLKARLLPLLGLWSDERAMHEISFFGVFVKMIPPL
jgi:hypothetical protein